VLPLEIVASKRPVVIRDLRAKEKFFVDDAYLNGYAKYLGPEATCVYLSLCRHADHSQQAFPSQKLIAEENGISERTVRRKLDILESLNLIYRERVRNRRGRWLCYLYVLLDKSEWLSPADFVSTGQRIHSPSATGSGGKKIYLGHQRTGSPIKDTEKDTHKKDTHITPSIVSPLKKYSSIKSIDEVVLEEISDKYKVPFDFVLVVKDRMENWLEAKGKRYSDYRRALMNWVSKEKESRLEKVQFYEKKRGIDASHL